MNKSPNGPIYQNGPPWDGHIWLADKSRFNLLDLEANDFNLKALVLGVRGINRFNGNVPLASKPYGYSVMEHMLLCHDYYIATGTVDPYTAMCILTHDLGECLSGDMSRCVKLIVGPAAGEFEQKCQAWVYRNLGLLLFSDRQKAISRVDDDVLKAEIRCFYGTPMAFSDAVYAGLMRLYVRQRALGDMMEEYIGLLDQYGLTI